MATGGRPTKLTPALQTRICKLIKDGNFRGVAAVAAGLGITTFKTWMSRGKEQKTGEFRDFRAAVLKAEQEAEVVMVARVVTASKTDAKHAEWWLERKRTRRWGRKATVEHTGDSGGPLVQITFVEVVRAAPKAPETEP